MAVIDIKEYRMKNGDDVLKVFCKPTKAFPSGGYFYADAEDIDLVQNNIWGLHQTGKRIRVESFSDDSLHLNYHQVHAYKVLNYLPSCIDHINGVTIDNRDNNLNLVSFSHNSRNKPSKGYSYRKDIHLFRTYITFDCKAEHCGYYLNEFRAVQAILEFRQKYYSEYDYNFLKDRRSDWDILDAELTGQISEEEATFRHVMRYAKENAWYVYRYGLEDYFRQYNVPIPAFKFDSQGFMIHPVTGERLCPF